MSSINQSSIISGGGHTNNEETLDQESKPLKDRAENVTKRSQSASSGGTVYQQGLVGSPEGNTSKMVDVIFPRWLGTLPIGEARTIVKTQDQCDSRESGLRERLLDIRERREEIPDRTMEVKSSISAAQSKLRSAGTRLGLSKLRISYKHEQQLEELRQESAEVDRQWMVLNNDARQLTEKLLDEKVDGSFRSMVDLLSQAKFNYIDATLHSIDGLKESISEAYSTCMKRQVYLSAGVREIVEKLLDHQGKLNKHREDPSQDVPLSVRLDRCSLEIQMTREHYSSVLGIWATDWLKHRNVSALQHRVCDTPLSNEAVVEALKERGFEDRAHRIVPKGGMVGPLKGVMRKDSRFVERGDNSSYVDETTISSLCEQQS
ncbi:hypothetical protein I302_100054 [Kwoniella bestiolae CBS 10118]|uniref:Uncharacterized protein n=1 Tax=Kwoniella bestiolae CBS 10118 TaxID=1296100 RepID=A0A1B9G413_9TREE|nr:hypothetical protein I302_03426 [Kwoniella bestiolae CBS 10118]OCF25753.1 hypothetical protein I302_03426 [Kwoniella bestiolae CBS 10118]